MKGELFPLPNYSGSILISVYRVYYTVEQCRAYKMCTGTVELTECTGTVEPTECTGTVEPTECTVEPTECILWSLQSVLRSLQSVLWSLYANVNC